jgi:hypothetical protein
MNEQKKKLGRKLLVATVGLATVSYVAACGSSVSTESTDAGSDAKIDSGISSGNLVPPDTGTPPPDIGSGNLVPPDTGVEDTGGTDTGSVKDTDVPPFDIGSGNLVPPPDASDI